MTSLNKALAANLLSVQRKLTPVAGKNGKKFSSMRVLKDANGNKLAHNLYRQYVSEDDFSNFPSFYKALDRLLSKFGGGSKGREVDEDNAPSNNDNKNNDKNNNNNNDKNNDGKDKF